MNRLIFILILMVTLLGCSSSQKGTIAELRKVEIAIDAEDIDGGIDTAIQSYERFLETTKETPMTAEAIRRLADLKVEKEYGLLADAPLSATVKTELAPPETIAPSEKKKEPSVRPATVKRNADSEKRSKPSGKLKKVSGRNDLPLDDDLERTGAQEAIALYQKLLKEYPQYDRNDQAFYQLLRAQEEQGQVEEAMQVMNRFVAEYPDSRHMDEIQFRRAEYFFARRQYSDAEKAYGSVVAIGEKSDFYTLALFKLGWSLYKQERYEEALLKYIALLDYKVKDNFDFETSTDGQEGKRVNDTLAIISQSFSNLGGASAVTDFFSKYGSRAYEDEIYANLAEYYFSKQRYSDAVATYTTFADRNPSHRKAPLFTLRVIGINKASGFSSQVVEAKKTFASRYAFGADYWKDFNPDNRPEVIEGLKLNLIDLANYYHARYQNEKFVKEKPANLKEALRWYREFLISFPNANESPAINYQLAELLLENNSFAEAAREYEKTAYLYPVFDKADKAGYAAVYAYRQLLQQVGEKEKEQVNQDLIRVSIKFAEFYPKHEKAAIVLAAAVDELYAHRDFKTALITSRYLLERFPTVTADIRRSALLVAAHSSYELADYRKAEVAYSELLQLLPEDDKLRPGLTGNLVASVYKQGEAANLQHNYKQAANHFLRAASVAPISSKIRPKAEYDGAVALIKVEEWQGAATVLTGFRKNFPNHELQKEVTKNLAFIYRENERFDLAAVEFERIEVESTVPALRQEALLTAAELYEKVNNLDHAAKVYRRYVEKFPEPVDFNIEIRDKLANNLLKQGKRDQYLDALRQIVALESEAGSGQTVQTRDIAGAAALVLANIDYEKFISVQLVQPFAENLKRKQTLMKKLNEAYTKLFDYEVGVITAEAIFRLAEVYADFSVALLSSERPEGLDSLELEQYELALEEQAYPFEEKAIEMHQSNLELLSKGIYNNWIDKSLAKLAKFMPARYAKTEVKNDQVASLAQFRFKNLALSPAVQTETMRTSGDRFTGSRESSAKIPPSDELPPKLLPKPGKVGAEN